MTEATTETPPELMSMPRCIAELITWQGKMSDSAFCREYGFKKDPSNWNKLKRWIQADPKEPDYGQPYFKGNLQQALDDCELMLRGIKERKAIAEKVRRGTKFIEFPHLKAVMGRIACLLGSEEPNDRLVVYLAPTGGGKSTLGREVVATHSGLIVECTEAWRESYPAALRAIAHKAKFGDDARNLGELERAAVEHFNAKTVLVFDEGEYFGAKSINVIKFLLNHTKIVILLLAIPAMWERVKRHAWAEAAQIVRRTDHTERLGLIQPPDILRFAEAAGVNLNGSSDASCAAIARAANSFGRYDLIVRVIHRLGLEEKQKPKHLSEVEAAVHAVQVMMGSIPGGAQ